MVCAVPVYTHCRQWFGPELRIYKAGGSTILLGWERMQRGNWRQATQNWPLSEAQGLILSFHLPRFTALGPWALWSDLSSTHGRGLGVFGMPLEPDDLLDKKDPFEASCFVVTFISSSKDVACWKVAFAVMEETELFATTSSLLCLMLTLGPCSIDYWAPSWGWPHDRSGSRKLRIWIAKDVSLQHFRFASLRKPPLFGWGRHNSKKRAWPYEYCESCRDLGLWRIGVTT